MLAQPTYYEGGPKKPLLRGMTHKLFLLLFPLLIWRLKPEIWTFCHTTWYGLCFGSMFVLLTSSCIYHHWTFSYKNFCLIRKIDMSIVTLTTVCNMAPALIVYDMWIDLSVVVCLAVLNILLMCMYHDPKRPFLVVFLIATLTCLCCILPRLIARVPTHHLPSLVAHAITVTVSLGLYWLAENDQLTPWFGIHEFIHLLSIVSFLNFVNFNHLLITEAMCI